MPGKTLTTNAGSVAKRMLHRAQSIRGGLEKANRETLEEARKTAVGFSQGRSYDPRRDKSRPYSLRRPHPRLPAFIVNKQTGEFERSWKTDHSGSGFLFRGRLYNDSRQAAFFAGQPTRWMIGRPILQEVNKVILGKRRSRMRQTVREGLKAL